MKEDWIPFNGEVSRRGRLARGAARIILAATVLLLLIEIPAPMSAQAAGQSLSGIVTDSSGKAVEHARVVLKNSTGLTAETTSDSAGRYEIPGLSPGAYELSVSAAGSPTKTLSVTITEELRQTMNVSLGVGLSLEDIGFAPAQAQGAAADQALLDKRSHMLQLHQRWGLITTIPLAATLITGGSAGGHNSSSSDRTLHAILGSTTAVLYGTSAYYALFAPKVAGTQTHGNIRLHKAVAWVHGAGMILTPILGAMAYHQKSNGESVHGVASAHGAVAITTAIAYAAAILTETFK